jgi:hypothetical protein
MKKKGEEGEYVHERVNLEFNADTVLNRVNKRVQDIITRYRPSRNTIDY